MRLKISFVMLAAFAAFSSMAAAQDFGVVESAETIDRGNFKLRVNPIMLFGDDEVGDGDSEVGFAGSAGYGFTDKLDVEAKLAVYDFATLVGADVEFWLMKG